MTLEVRVVTPEREVFSGQAAMVVARGVDGDVGIMAGHAPLLIQLAIGPLKINTGSAPAYAVVDGGFMHVSSEGDATRVDVLASHAEMATEIDAEAARRRKDHAEGKLRDGDDAAARAELAKAMARINLIG